MTAPEPARNWQEERLERLWSSPITRCAGCGGWRFASGWCDYCNPDREEW
jgi:hypothetical protein